MRAHEYAAPTCKDNEPCEESCHEHNGSMGEAKVSAVRKPHRTLQRVTDLATGATITSDDLLAIDPDRYQKIRRNAAAARRKGSAVYVCDMCGHGVYAPKEARTRLPFWRHHNGAPTACPWWTGDPATVDQRSAAQFQGAQESPLHSWLKHQVGEILAIDQSTQAGSIHIDEYLKGETGNRRPDVRAINGGRRLAFEIQLSSTQLPIIDSREHFYNREGYNLVWLTWKFQAVPRRLMLTAFVDIFYSHNKNLFSLDEEVLDRARKEGRFLVRCHWEEGRDWRSAILRCLISIGPRRAWPTGLRLGMSTSCSAGATPWLTPIFRGRPVRTCSRS